MSVQVRVHLSACPEHTPGFQAVYHGAAVYPRHLEHSLPLGEVRVTWARVKPEATTRQMSCPVRQRLTHSSALTSVHYEFPVSSPQWQMTSQILCLMCLSVWASLREEAGQRLPRLCVLHSLNLIRLESSKAPSDGPADRRLISHSGPLPCSRSGYSNHAAANSVAWQPPTAKAHSIRTSYRGLRNLYFKRGMLCVSKCAGVSSMTLCLMAIDQRLVYFDPLRVSR
jgi:hypothetical protein